MVVILIVSPPPGATPDGATYHYIDHGDVAPRRAPLGGLGGHKRSDRDSGHGTPTPSSTNGVNSSTSASLLSSLSSQVDPDNLQSINKEGE